MTLQSVYCSVAERAEATLAHPLAIPTYLVTRVTLGYLAPDALVSMQSDFANLTLLLLLGAQVRKSAKIEREVDALAEAHPGVDHEQLREE